MDKKDRSPLRRLEPTKKYILALVIALVFIIAAFSWFVYTLRSSVYKTQLANMQELAEHDITTIQNFLDDDWKDLQGIASKASLKRDASDMDLVAFLREEQVQSDFEDIYLVDEDYNLYTSTGVETADREVLENEYLVSSHVMSSRNVLGDGSDKDYLYSGVKLNGININGHHIVEIIGKLDLVKIQDRIRISNYSGKGYSSVFDKDGTMIIGINAGGQRLTNYYDYLANNTDLGVDGTDKVREKTAEDLSFTETIVDRYTTQTSVIGFQAIQGLDWYFIMSVPKTVFDQQNREMLRLLLIMLSVILVALLAMMLYMLRSQVILARQREQEKQREALETALDQAKVASRAKTAFLFNMSHDIRTPLNAVLGLSNMATKYQDDPDKIGYYMEQIQIACRQLLSIVNNVLEVSRIESGKVKIDEEVVDTDEIFEGLKTVFMNQSRAKKLHLFFANEIKNRFLYMDRTHVEEVIVNLVSNAMKYTEDDGTVNVALSDTQGEDKEHTVLRAVISDNGIGMSEEYQERLFEEFERERNSTVSKIQGTGLGLSIVKKLTDMMHGSIDVNSKKGEGTCIAVEIPLRIAEAPNMIIPEEFQMEEISFEGKRILMAEDNDINAMIAEDTLSEIGFAVDRAENGKECVDMLAAADEDYYDLVLMDIQMPVMDGYQATQQIRILNNEKKSKLPIIAMTANAFQEDRINAFRAGMNAHVGKPIDSDRLLSTVKNIMKSRNYQINNQDMNAFRMQYEKLGCTIGYFIYDAGDAGHISFCDEVTAAIFGCHTVDEFLAYTGGTFEGMVHPEDYQKVRAAIDEQIARSSKDLDPVDYRIVRKDGEVRQVKDIGLIAFNGERKQFYVYIVDVTDVDMLFNENMMDVDELLVENGMSEGELSRLDQGVYIADASRRIIYWNKAAERITGYKRAEIVGMNCYHTALKHQDQWGTYVCSGLCPMMKAILNGESVTEELSAYCQNGDRKLLTIRTEPLYKDGNICGAIEYFVELEN